MIKIVINANCNDMELADFIEVGKIIDEHTVYKIKDNVLIIEVYGPLVEVIKDYFDRFKINYTYATFQSTKS